MKKLLLISLSFCFLLISYISNGQTVIFNPADQELAVQEDGAGAELVDFTTYSSVSPSFVANNYSPLWTKTWSSAKIKFDDNGTTVTEIVPTVKPVNTELASYLITNPLTVTAEGTVTLKYQGFYRFGSNADQSIEILITTEDPNSSNDPFSHPSWTSVKTDADANFYNQKKVDGSYVDLDKSLITIDEVDLTDYVTVDQQFWIAFKVNYEKVSGNNISRQIYFASMVIENEASVEVISPDFTLDPSSPSIEEGIAGIEVSTITTIDNGLVNTYTLSGDNADLFEITDANVIQTVADIDYATYQSIELTIVATGDNNEITEKTINISVTEKEITTVAPSNLAVNLSDAKESLAVNTNLGNVTYDGDPAVLKLGQSIFHQTTQEKGTESPVYNGLVQYKSTTNSTESAWDGAMWTHTWGTALVNFSTGEESVPTVKPGNGNPFDTYLILDPIDVSGASSIDLTYSGFYRFGGKGHSAQNIEILWTNVEPTDPLNHTNWNVISNNAQEEEFPKIDSPSNILDRSSLPKFNIDLTAILSGEEQIWIAFKASYLREEVSRFLYLTDIDVSVEKEDNYLALNGNDIVLQNELDYLTDNQIDYLLLASNEGGSTHHFFQVDVIPTPDFNLSFSEVTIEEGEAGIAISSINEVDKNVTVNYSLEGDNADLFTIDESNNIVSAALIEYASHTSFSLQVVATADNGEITKKPLSIEVTEKPVITPEVPEFTLESSNVSIEEGEAGISITSINEVDKGLVVVYTLEGENADFFTIDESKNIISSQAIVYATHPSFSLEVVGTADNNEVLRRNLLIQVTEKVIILPDFTLASSNVNIEEGDAGISITSINEVDNGLTVIYTLEGDNADYFTIDESKNIVTAQAIAYADITSFSLEVVGTGDNDQITRKELSIQVTEKPVVVQAPSNLSIDVTEVVETTASGTNIGTVSYDGDDVSLAMISPLFHQETQEKATEEPVFNGLTQYTSATTSTESVWDGAMWTKQWSTALVNFSTGWESVPAVKPAKGNTFDSYLVTTSIDIENATSISLNYGGFYRYGGKGHSAQNLEILWTNVEPTDPLTHTSWNTITENAGEEDFPQIDNPSQTVERSTIPTKTLDLRTVLEGQERVWIAFKVTYLQNEVSRFLYLTTVDVNVEKENAFIALDGNNLMLQQSLDYLTNPTLALSLQATNAGGSTSKSFEIAVIPVPSFTLSSTTPTITEGEAGIVVASISEVDKGTVVTYTLEGENADFFSVDESKNIVSTKTIDFATYPSFSLEVVGTADNGQVVKESIEVQVVEEDVVLPEFTLSSSNVSIEEGEEGIVISSITDVDKGLEVVYTLEGENADFFTINNTKTIVSSSVISYATHTSFALQVVGTGNNGQVIKQSLNIQVTEKVIVVPEAPEFTLSSSNASIEEGEAGILITTITEVDKGLEVVYTLEGENADFFTIDESKNIVSSKAIDFATYPSFSLEVVGTGNNNETLRNSLSITVTEKTELVTAPSNLSVDISEILETTTIDSKVGTISYDGDESSVSFVEQLFHQETQEKATEDPAFNGLTQYTSATTSTESIWDGAMWTQQWSTALVNFSTGWESVPTVKPAKKGIFDAYLVTAPIELKDASSITLNYGGFYRYGGKGHTAQNIEILWTNVEPTDAINHTDWNVITDNAGEEEFPKNDNPSQSVDRSTIPVKSLDLTTILAGQEKVWIAFKVSYLQADVSRFLYLTTIDVNVEKENDYLTIEGNDLKLKNELDYLSNSTLNFTLQAINEGGAISNTFDIAVTPIPSFTLSSTTSTIIEGEAGINVASISEVDKGIVVTYTLEGENADFFTVDESKNIVSTKAIDFATYPSFSLEVVGTADNGQVAKENIEIQVVKEDVVLPEFTLSSSNVSIEEGTAGIVISSITEVDKGLEVVYTLEGENADFFTIDDTKTIVSSSTILYATHPTFALQVVGTGNNGQVVKQSLNIQVTEQVIVVPESPEFTLSSSNVTIREGEAGILVASITEVDKGLEVVYTLDGENADFFLVDESNNIVSAQAIAFATHPSFTLEVVGTANNGEVLKNSLSIAVKEKDAEIVAPTNLALNVTEVIESTALNTKISTVTYEGDEASLSIMSQAFHQTTQEKATEDPAFNGLTQYTSASNSTESIWDGAMWTKQWSTALVNFSTGWESVPTVKPAKEGIFDAYLITKPISVKEASTIVLNYGGFYRYGGKGHTAQNIEILWTNVEPTDAINHTDWNVITENAGEEEFPKIDSPSKTVERSAIPVKSLDLTSALAGEEQVWIAFKVSYLQPEVSRFLYITTLDVNVESNEGYVSIQNRDLILSKELNYLEDTTINMIISASNTAGSTTETFNIEVIPVPEFTLNESVVTVEESDENLEITSISSVDKKLAITYSLEGENADLFGIIDNKIVSTSPLKAVSTPQIDLIVKGTYENGQTTTQSLQINVIEPIPALEVTISSSKNSVITVEETITAGTTIGVVSIANVPEGEIPTVIIKGDHTDKLTLSPAYEIQTVGTLDIGEYVFEVEASVEGMETVTELFTLNVIEEITPPSEEQWTPEIWNDYVVKGDRSMLPNFSYAGYHYGEEEIPVKEVTHVGTDLGIIPNDNLDDTDALNSALETISKAGGGVLLLPKGQYDFLTEEIAGDHSNLKKISLSGNNVVLRGEGQGEDGTLLYFHNKIPRKSTEYGTFAMRFWGRDGQALSTVANSAIKGDRFIETAEETEIKAGDFIQISMSNTEGDDAVSRKMTYPTRGHANWTNYNREKAFMWVVEVIKVEGTHLTLREPLPIDIEKRYNAVVSSTNMSKEVGIENLRFKSAWEGEYVHHGKYSDGSVATPSEVYEMDYGWCALQLSKLSNSWVKNVTFENFTWDVSVGFSKSLTLEGIEVIGKEGHHGLKVNGYGNLIKNSKVTAYRTHPIGGSGVMIGNVFTNIEIADYDGMIDFHGGGFPAFNLIENTNNIRVEGSGSSDNMPHAGIGNVFWNLEAPKEIANINNEVFHAWWMALNVDANQSYLMYPQSKVVGVYNDEANNLQIAGDRSDRSNEAIYVEGLNKKGVQPASLYAAQLEKRLSEKNLVSALIVNNQNIKEFKPSQKEYYVAHNSSELVMPSIIVDTDNEATVTVNSINELSGSKHVITVNLDGKSETYTIHYGKNEELTENIESASIADAFVRGGTHASKNYGSNTKLEVQTAPNSDYARESYLLFNLDTLTKNNYKTEVALNLFGKISKGTSISIEVLMAKSSFDETSITMNTLPKSLFKRVGFKEIEYSEENHWHQIPLHLGEIESSEYTFIIREITNVLADGGAIYSSFNSKESENMKPFISMYSFEAKQIEMIRNAAISSVEYKVTQPEDETEVGLLEGISITEDRTSFLTKVFPSEGGTLKVFSPEGQLIQEDVYNGCIIENTSQDGLLTYSYEVVSGDYFEAPVLEDTYVTSQYPKDDFGSSDYLEIGREDKAAYVRIDLASIDTLKQGFLRLYADKTNNRLDADIKLYSVDNTSWYASEISFENTLNSPSDVLAGKQELDIQKSIPSIENKGDKVEYYFDLSDFIKSQLKEGKTETTIKIMGSEWVRFTSSNIENLPQAAFFFTGKKQDDIPTSVETEEWSDLVNIYPVPSSDIITVDLKKLGKENNMKIYSMMGGLVKDISIGTVSTTVDISNLPHGIYLVHLMIDNHKVVERIVKQ